MCQSQEKFKILGMSTRLEEEFEILGTFPFCEAIELLSDKENKADAIIGPRGGILILDFLGGLVYRAENSLGEHDKPYFQATDYLGKWKLLRKRR